MWNAGRCSRINLAEECTQGGHSDFDGRRWYAYELIHPSCNSSSILHPKISVLLDYIGYCPSLWCPGWCSLLWHSLSLRRRSVATPFEVILFSDKSCASATVQLKQHSNSPCCHSMPLFLAIPISRRLLKYGESHLT